MSEAPGFPDLPYEVQWKIFCLLPSKDLLTRVRLVCKDWHLFIEEELESGRLRPVVSIDRCNTSTDECIAVCRKFKISELRLKSFTSGKELNAVLQGLPGFKLKKLSLLECDLHHLDGEVLPNVESLSVLDSPASQSFWKVVANRAWTENLVELTVPHVKGDHLQLILERNKSRLQQVHVGEVSNELLHFICLKFRLTHLTFHGGKVTYSGAIALLQCRTTLRSLSIKNPEYLTRYALAMMADGLTKLESLKLFWDGKMFVTNPWSFDYCLDRQEQRVDALFEGGQLSSLTEVDLSGFYQTVDDKVMQLFCLNHLSSHTVGLMSRHPSKISLAHCYHVTDAGAQWLVGSYYSVGLKQLDLSGTGATGNCFLRKMPSLSTLKLEACSFIGASGLACIGMSCPAVTTLSLSKCKQLNDCDVSSLLRSLKHLKELDLSYTNVSGKCFAGTSSTQLKVLNLSCTQKLTDDSFAGVMTNCSRLENLDVSATRITSLTSRGIRLPELRTLRADLCPKLFAAVTTAHDLDRSFPSLRVLSVYGCDLAGLDSSWATEIRGRCKWVRSVIVTTSDPGDEEGDKRRARLSEFARRRGLYLTDWAKTKSKMSKGRPLMLSQVWLQSLE